MIANIMNNKKKAFPAHEKNPTSSSNNICIAQNVENINCFRYTVYSGFLTF